MFHIGFIGYISQAIAGTANIAIFRSNILFFDQFDSASVLRLFNVPTGVHLTDFCAKRHFLQIFKISVFFSLNEIIKFI